MLNIPKPIVFVDTNSVDNKSSATIFLGGRADLEKISKRADIVLPRVVYDEVRKHIRTFLWSQKKSFSNNPHRYILGISEEDIAGVDIDAYIDNLESSEVIHYRVADLQDETNVYKEIYRHAIEGTAPFEVDGDKGFKDTLIAKTIDQFVITNPRKEVFLFTKDHRLSEYFNDSTVQIIDGFQAFDRLYSEDKLEDEGIRERIINYLKEVGEEIAKDSVPDDQWLNSEEDIVALYKGSTEIYVLIDAIHREPQSYIKTDIHTAIDSMAQIDSFQAAHDAIANFDCIFPYLSMKDIEQIAHNMLLNDQIYGIVIDDDISQFAAIIFYALDNNGESKLATEIRALYKLNLLTKEQMEQLPF